MATSLPLFRPTGAEPESAPPARHLGWGRRCNLGCPSCSRLPPLSDASGPPGGVTVVGGGEPMLEPDLLTRLRQLQGTVHLETNGTLLAVPGNVLRLRRAGVAAVRLFLPGWDEAATDALARVPGTAALQAAAARHLLAAGVGLGFVVPVTLEHAPRLTDWLTRAEHLAETRPPDAGPLEVSLAWSVPDAAAITEELELALGRLALAGIRRGMVVRFDGPRAPAPCAFRQPAAFASLFAGPASPRPRPPACAACALSSTCAGPAPGAAARALPPPAADDVVGRAAITTLLEAGSVQAWAAAGEAQRWGRQNFISIGDEPDVVRGVAVRSALARAFFHCNQDCVFCWVDLDQARVPTAAFDQALFLMAAEGMRALSITGGEPTLDKRLPDQLRLARALGVEQLTLQTNAVRLAQRALAETLVAAGLNRAFVSLHGATGAVSDAITRAPDTFERTLAGVRNLLDLGVSVGVGVVFTHENRSQARELVHLVGTRLAGADLTLSVAAPVNESVDVGLVTPRYSELAPALREAARTAQELGVRFSGLLGQCGVPPCILDADPICFPELALAHGRWSAPQDFVHVEACGGCSLRGSCPGVRRAYAAVHGIDELHPV